MSSSWAAVRHGLHRQVLLHVYIRLLHPLPRTTTAIQLFLFVVVVSESKTLYLEVHNPASSGVALFISALVYAGIFGYLYYDIYLNVDRK